jgi:tRNA(fMet)-specific endonuclease VapC
VTRYLLDTNVLSEVTRHVPHPRVLARLSEVEGLASLAAITWYELRFGVRRLPAGHRRAALEAFVRGLPARFPVLAYDQRAASWHAEERARLESIGQPPSFADGQIAAIAATHGLVLVTRNRPDFAGFHDVRVESWWEAEP